MKLLRIAVEKQRWDLAAHAIILVTATVLKNGDKPALIKRGSNNPISRTNGYPGVGMVKQNRRRSFER